MWRNSMRAAILVGDPSPGWAVAISVGMESRDGGWGSVSVDMAVVSRMGSTVVHKGGAGVDQ